jgi:hypothetical protein
VKTFRLNLFGTILIIIGVIYGCLQSAGYGNHGVPKTTPEAICNLITVLIVLTGYVMCALSHVFDEGDKE